jgi:hypothetical protein
MGGKSDLCLYFGESAVVDLSRPNDLNLFAALTDVSENGIDALLVDRPQSL